MPTLQTYHIHLAGLVQGVGFRPFVYRLAQQMGLAGSVSNGADGVHIWLQANAPAANTFYQRVLHEAPVQSRITRHSMQQVAQRLFHGFHITESGNGSGQHLLPAPDYAICSACREEMQQPGNRRYQYPFITCTHCGPRYSIVQQLPYDRPHTTMRHFEQCPECLQEYHNPANRRFYSQTNCCPACGPRLSLYRNGQEVPLVQQAIISQIAHTINQGGIAAVKGVGGFLLLCDAQNAAAIQLLRTRKQRPAKPFALMYPSIQAVEKDFRLRPVEQEWLEGPVAPVVLLKPHTGCVVAHTAGLLAPGLDKLGVMLPYAPLFQLIAQQLNRPLVATSANISGSPIIYTNHDALELLPAIADIIVTHNRDITAPQDDSVLQFTDIHGQIILLRRGRGLAPNHPEVITGTGHTVLACGASLKSSITLAHGGEVYTSQYLGDTESWEARQAYQTTAENLLRLFNTAPEAVIADMHPGYYTRQYAQQCSSKYNCSLVYVQHHAAHAAAILAGAQLLRHEQPVLCAVWDGTGLGTDGNLWGGEFFVYRQQQLNRMAVLQQLPVIAGDVMAKQPRLSALAFCAATGISTEKIQPQFTAAEWHNYGQLLAAPAIYTGSMGRLFDAVAALTGICAIQTWEGQAALLLEQAATRWLQRHEAAPYTLLPQQGFVSLQPMAAQIMSDLEQGAEAGFIAARFHMALSMLAVEAARQAGAADICCSGGVFQNALLCDLLRNHTGKGLQLHLHRHLPPNDENIAYGQWVYYNSGMHLAAGNHTSHSFTAVPAAGTALSTSLCV